MRLPGIAINNSRFTIMVVILLALFGVNAIVNMPKSEDPPVSKPGSSIFVIYPGAGPEDLEQLVIDPIEEALNELDDIKSINSRCEDGLASVAIEFLAGSDPDEKFSDVNEKINSVSSQLPPEIVQLETMKWSISDTNFMQLALTSDSAGYRELEKYADRLKRKLSRVPNIKRANILGFPEQEIRVSLNLEKMAHMKIPLNRVLGVIRAANQNIPGGTIDSGGRRFNIKTSGSFESLREIEDTVIHTEGTKVVYLRDIAAVHLDYEDSKHVARFKKIPAVFVTVTQKENTNIFAIMEKLEPLVEEFSSQLPTSIQLYKVHDQSESVDTRLRDFFINLVQGIILVGIVIFLAIGIRGSLIVMTAIPFSLLMGLGFIYLNGYGLQQISISGMVITLGLLVDNAIVVTENISRFRTQGANRIEAAIKGTSQIGWAIVSATATTVLAFLPIAMMQDVSGEFIRSMPLTVIYTLSASLLIALAVTPLMSTGLMRSIQPGRFRSALDRFIDTRYSHWLSYALKKPKTIIAAAFLVFVCSLALGPLVGLSFFPKTDKNVFFINIEAPSGTSLDKTDTIAKEIEGILDRQPEVAFYTTNIGRSNPRIYYNIIEKRNRSNIGQFFVQLKDNIQLEQTNDVIERLRHTFSNYPKARLEIKELEQGPPVNAPVEIKIQGEKMEMIKKIARDVETMFRQTPGLINIDNPLDSARTDLRVRVNRDKAAMHGIRLDDIDRSVRMAVAGIPISQYRDKEGNDYDIVVRSTFESEVGLEVFDKIFLPCAGGQLIPLKEVATIELSTNSSLINHFNLQRSATVTADVLRGRSTPKITERLIRKLDGYHWPEGYYYEVWGEKKSQEESFGGMGSAILLAIIAIFAVLVLQFRSFMQPLIVYAALPLAIIGSILGLLITGYTFSFTAFVGLTSLVGIVVNNSIILVDYTNQLRKEGKDIVAALQEAGETRFTPIILTTMTTIGGLLPLTLRGGELWAPMGWTIICGLLTSTVLTLIIVPVLYRLFCRK
jgi:multidrug efflux pump subunit AcrB